MNLKGIFRRLALIVSMFFPSSIVGYMSRLMLQGGFSTSPKLYLAASIITSSLLSVAAFFISAPLVSHTTALLIMALMFVTVEAAFYVVLIMAADNRARKIEEVLPDALQMMAANVRAGMTVENAIWMSARPEFGPLEDEIKKVSGKSFGGMPIANALSEMSYRVRSSLLERAVRLLVESISLGGEIAPILDEVAQDLKATTMLKREIMNATMMYTIFIIFTSLVASPLLFSISVYYSEMSATLASQKASTSFNQTTTAGKSRFSGGLMRFMGTGAGQVIPPEEVRNFAIYAISITTFFGALTLAQIRQGRLTRGLKYIPIFMVTALGIFFITLTALHSMFKGFMPS
ncbi:MAG: type II secretion system F family protein [Candidatus Micrarchaeota archaeon]